MADTLLNRDGLLASPAWKPSLDALPKSNIGWALGEVGLPDYKSLHRWSTSNPEAYWKLAIERLGIAFQGQPLGVAANLHSNAPVWLPEARINIVDSCFQADPDSAAIISSSGSEKLEVVTVAELKGLAGQVAATLVSNGAKPGERVALILPLNALSVAIYLGVIAAGLAVVCIPESFAADEIATRLRLADAKLVFTQDFILRGSKKLPLYDRVIQANPPAIVVVNVSDKNDIAVRQQDASYDRWIKTDSSSPLAAAPQEFVSILFSSGTTGDPKAIPWDHTTPIKCAADAHFHHNIQPGDVVCWPTSLGWMMGPWLVFASLINRATIAIYDQSPLESGFARFVQDAEVTMLGVVPSLVRAWRNSRNMESSDWTKIRAFSSTGECSNADDMLYLMALAGGRPVIEYCGGTEIGGAYLTSTVVQPNVPGTFSTPALGLDVDIRDEHGEPAPSGEAYIVGPSIGLSLTSLNKNHEAIYYADCPVAASGQRLRRHGDEIVALPGGYYRILGRSDDTMNLGGIKVGCADIERVVGRINGVVEAAAVAAPVANGGPSRLILFVVKEPGADFAEMDLRAAAQALIKEHLNPLFHVDEVRIVDKLPRTASNKVMRRELRKLI